MPKVDIFLFYFLGEFGSRLVFTLTLPPPSPSCKILCFGVFEKFPIARDWLKLFLKGIAWRYMLLLITSSFLFSLYLSPKALH